MAWQFPLHSGKAFGWPGRIMIFAAGLGTCGFIVTGLVIWRQKARASSGSARRTTRPTPAAGLAPAE